MREMSLKEIKGRLLNSTSHAAISHALVGHAYHRADQPPASTDAVVCRKHNEPSVSLATGEIGAPSIFDASIQLPAGLLDANRAIDCVAAWVPKMLHKLTPEYSQDWFRILLRKALREDRPTLSEYAFHLANAGDKIAGEEMRRVAVEISRGELASGPGQHLHLRHYCDGILLQQQKRRPGRPWHNTYVRDTEICALIWYVHRELKKYDVRATRTRASHGDDTKRHSAISIVVVALSRNGLNIEETHVQDNIWNSERGKLVRTLLDEVAHR